LPILSLRKTQRKDQKQRKKKGFHNMNFKITWNQNKT